jgi:MGT family glycosyltransferase
VNIVALCGTHWGHMQRMLPMLEGLASAGCPPVVMTKADFKGAVEGTGATHHDLYEAFPLEAADDESIPVSSRFVTFAGVYAEALTERVAGLHPDLILYDTFEVSGPLVGRALGIPYVNVCASHDAEPKAAIEALAAALPLRPSRRCLEAIERLRTSHGMHDAGPLCFFAQQSPFLNLYCEPPQFISEATRRSFEPIDYIGSLLPEFSKRRTTLTGDAFRPGARLKVLISFGTVIWRYFADIALEAMRTFAEVLGDTEGADAIISLGRWQIEPEKRAQLERPNVRVEAFVDQWSVLEAADIFVTHQGLNSTHEAIYHRVPMISYPFYTDQPAMAARCEALGLSIIPARAPLATLSANDVRGALRRLADERDTFAARLSEAREWEAQVIAERPRVVQRLLSLAAERRGGFIDASS